MGGGNGTWQGYCGQTRGLGWGGSLGQSGGRELGEILGQGPSLGLGGGDGQRIYPEWVTSADPSITVWCVPRVDGMKPPFASVVDILTVTATTFSMEKLGATRLAVMPDIDTSQYTRKERTGRQLIVRGYPPASE